MNFINNLLGADNAFYFYIFVVIIFSVYFVLTMSVYLYTYVFKKYQLKRFKIQKDWPPLSDIISDISWSMSSMLIWVVMTGALIYLIGHGYTKVYLNVADWGIPYFIFTLVLFVFLHDTYYYFAHKSMHQWDFMWKYVHSVHHTSRNPTPFSIFAFGPLEAMYLGFYFILIAFIIPINIYVIMLVFITNSFANIVGHMGYEFLELNINKKWSKYILNSIHHNMHHKYARHNYSIYFPFWDNFMNTMNPEYERESEEFYNNKHKTHEQ